MRPRQEKSPDPSRNVLSPAGDNRMDAASVACVLE